MNKIDDNRFFHIWLHDSELLALGFTLAERGMFDLASIVYRLAAESEKDDFIEDAYEDGEEVLLRLDIDVNLHHITASPVAVPPSFLGEDDEDGDLDI